MDPNLEIPFGSAVERQPNAELPLINREGLYNQPLDDQREGANEIVNLESNSPVLYECSFCAATFSKKHNLVEHEKRIHFFISFFCWVCEVNQRMSLRNMKNHFAGHEIQISRQTGFLKLNGNSIFNIYQKSFDDEWTFNPFVDENLDDIVKMIKINAAIFNRIIVNLSCKLWFEPKANLENDSPLYRWVSVNSFSVDFNEIQLTNKVKKSGLDLFSTWLSQDSIDDNGSGYVYYATSDIKLKCIKNLQFGCQIENSNLNEFITELESKGILLNVDVSSHCFYHCINSHFKGCVSPQDQQLLNEVNKPLVSFLDLENLPHDMLSFGIRIFNLIQFGKDQFRLQCIFTSSHFHSKQEKVDLLAVCGESDISAHFVLIINVASLVRRCLNVSKNQSCYICKFCFQKSSYRSKVIEQHEVYCLSNPDKNRDNRQHSLGLANFLDNIQFSAEKKFLQCNNRGRSAPNFFGFLDFETVFSSLADSYAQIKVCTKHRMAGLTECSCSQTIKSDKIESLSYHFILLDFNLNKVVFDKYYIQKNEIEEKAGEHLVSILLKLSYAISLINSIEYPIDMTFEQKVSHEQSTHCQHCKRRFSDSPQGVHEILNSSRSDLESCKIGVSVAWRKTAHHLHHVKNNNYVSSICSKCNLSIQSRYQSVPIFCHNFSRFDHVFILKSICKYWGSSGLQTLSKSENNIMAIKAKPFDLKDSLNFLSGSLDNNIELVKKSCNVECRLCSLQNQCSACLLESEKNLISTFSHVYDSELCWVGGKFSLQRFKDNLKKLAFPYQLLTKYDDLVSMTEFPSYENFFSILKGKNVDINEYNSARCYFEKYCSNMEEFLQVYNMLDTYLLCSVWRVMADILKEKLDYHPENFNSLPALSLEVATSLLCKNPDENTDTCIELFGAENKDIYVKCQENIRGGIVLVNSKFEIDGRFKNVFNLNEMDDGWVDGWMDKNKDELIYLDATNLYGYCLSDLLPYADYQHVSQSFIERLNHILTFPNQEQKMRALNSLLPDESNIGFAFEIKILEIPDYLHEFPPFYGRRGIRPDEISPADFYNYRTNYDEDYSGKENPILIPLLTPNETTFSHYRLIKEAIKYGSKIQIISGVKFQQKYLFRDYISLLAKLRSDTDNPAHAKIFKLLANALYGKLLQSIFKYSKRRDFLFLDPDCDEEISNVSLSRLKEIIDERHRSKRKFLFSDLKILDSDFIMVESEEIDVKATNCPLIAFTILELAKLRNFSFYWKMKCMSPKTDLIYCDTDSFILKINQQWYDEMRGMKEEFDFSNASLKFKEMMNISYEEQMSTHGVLGKYKSEICKDSILVCVVALQKKTYCILSLTKVKCDECKRWTASCVCGFYSGIQLYKFSFTPHSKGKDLKQLNFTLFLDALLGKNYTTQTRYRFEQRGKQLTLNLKKYRGLINFDDTNYQLSCKIHNIPLCSTNYSKFYCNRNSCKDAFKVMNLMKENLFQSDRQTFFHLNKNGDFQIWTGSI